MHLPGVLLFGAVALLASSNAQLHSNPVSLTSLEPNGITSANPAEAHSGQSVKDGDPVDEDDDDDEEDERIFNFKGFLGIEKLQQSFQSKVTLGKLCSWISQEKSPDHVFKRFGLHKPRKNFDSEDFIMWASYTISVIQHEPEKAMLTTLRKYYKEDELLRKLVKVKGGDVADRIFSMLYTEWVAAKKSSLDVFVAFGLHEARTVDAKHASFAKWLDFIKLQSKNQGESGLIMLTAVTGHLSYSDLMQLLGEGKTEAAQIVRNMLSHYWKKKDLNGAFEVASFKGDGELMTSAGFQAWLKFMSGHNKTNPNQKAGVFETMERFFGEKKLTTIIVAGLKDPKTSEVSKGLLSEQLAQWIKEGKRPRFEDNAMAAIFEKLQLGGDKNVITIPLNIWHQYSIYTEQQSSLIKILLENYESDALVKMILEAKTTKGSETTAKWVEGRLFMHWVDEATSSGRDRGTVARAALQLDQSSDNGKPNPFQGVYDDFMVFSKFPKDLKVDAAGTTLDTVQKKADDSRLFKEKREEANEKLKKEQEAAEVEVSTKTRKTLRDFLMEPQ